jgi:hypothetical protein
MNPPRKEPTDVRLGVVKRGNRLPNRAFVGLINRVGGGAPDIVRTIHYRSGFWGNGFSSMLQEAMRGPSYWRVGERELFAGYTSYLNLCPF